MLITEKQIFDGAVALVAGAMANPGNAHLLFDQYQQAQALATAINAIGQAIMQSGGTVLREPSQGIFSDP